MAADRVDSGPSKLCNATRILSFTVGCLCLIMERLSAQLAACRVLVALRKPKPPIERGTLATSWDLAFCTSVPRSLQRHLHNPSSCPSANPRTKSGPTGRNAMKKAASQALLGSCPEEVGGLGGEHANGLPRSPRDPEGSPRLG